MLKDASCCNGTQVVCNVFHRTVHGTTCKACRFRAVHLERANSTNDRHRVNVDIPREPLRARAGSVPAGHSVCASFQHCQTTPLCEY